MIVVILIIILQFCQLRYLQIFGMCDQYILRHFKLDNDTWYVNQEMKLISISMAVIILFALLCTIGYMQSLIYVWIIIFIVLIFMFILYVHNMQILYLYYISNYTNF